MDDKISIKENCIFNRLSGNSGGLVVSVTDCQSSGSGSNPGKDRHFLSILL